MVAIRFNENSKLPHLLGPLFGGGGVICWPCKTVASCNLGVGSVWSASHLSPINFQMLNYAILMRNNWISRIFSQIWPKKCAFS